MVGREVELTDRLADAALRDATARAILSVLREPLLEHLKEIAMNPDQLPKTRTARRFRKFFEEQGIVEGKREGLLNILAARKLPLSDEARGTIDACNDAKLLDQWIVKATAAGSVDEVLSLTAAAD